MASQSRRIRIADSSHGDRCYAYIDEGSGRCKAEAEGESEVRVGAAIIGCLTDQKFPAVCTPQTPHFNKSWS
jgi:hypothetical protein